MDAWQQSMRDLPVGVLSAVAAFDAVETALAETERMLVDGFFPRRHDDLRLAAIEREFINKEKKWSYEHHVQMRAGLALLRTFVERHMSTNSLTRGWPAPS